MRLSCAVIAGLHIIAVAAIAHTDDALAIQEKYAVDYQYHVRVHVDLDGMLLLSADKDARATKLEVSGDSVIEYDERVLGLTKDDEVDKTARVFREVKLQRRVGERKQDATIRDEVKRMILLRRENTKVPFSPDGALTWGEIDLVRTDVFTPSLKGMLPDRAVRPGDRWKASRVAVLALTDMAIIDAGDLDCKFDQVQVVGKNRVARIEFAGTIRGTNEDGPNEQKLDGYLYFDLETHHISYLSLRGVHILTDKDGKETGRLTGRFVLSRQVNTRCKELADESLKEVALDPNDDNTRLLYDNPDLGVKFLYSRRWRVSERANQVTLDTEGGNGLLVSVEALDRLPTAAQFLTEVRRDLDKMKSKISRASTPQSVREKPLLEEFNLDAEVNGQRAFLQYYVTKQTGGGATAAARIVPGDGEAEIRKEVERIVRSLEITRK
jgi:hypothetical protein